MIDLIIKNGTVVSSQGVLKTDVAVIDEKIAALGATSAFTKAETVIDASGKIVIPGGIDTHSHIENVGYFKTMGGETGETWGTGTIASAIGGTTTTIDFAQQEKGKSLMDAVKMQLARAKALSASIHSLPARCGLSAPVGKGSTPACSALR